MSNWTAKSQPAAGGGRRWYTRLWPGLAAAALVVLADAAIERDGPERLLLRWIRVAAQHPLRVGLAGCLLAWGFRPAGPPAPCMGPEAPPGTSGALNAGKIGPTSL